jgi:hypothetical protein
LQGVKKTNREVVVVHGIFKELILGTTLLFFGLAAHSQTSIPTQTLDTEDEAQARGFLPFSHHLPRFAFNSLLDSPDSQATGRQSWGSISGTILDRTGAVSVGAKVRLTRKHPFLSQEVASGNNGQYSFSHVPPGSFQITVTAPGFATQVFSANLRPGQVFLVPPIVLAVAVATTATEVRVELPTVEVAEAQIKEQEKQRVLGFVPNFYVSYIHNAAPLTPKQKFQLAWKTAVDPITFLGTGIYAGLEQAADRYPEYGQGAQGYAKRFGAGYADALSGIFIGNAILPSLLKQDPRYFYKGTGTTRSRMLYAIASPVICKGDNKRWQPNYSYILGSIASGAISTLYVPTDDRNRASLIFENALIRIGEGSLGGVLQEFVLPHLTPHIRHHKPSQP